MLPDSCSDASRSLRLARLAARPDRGSARRATSSRLRGDHGKPRAIVIASAHFGTHRPAVVADAKPGMIYDFGGMPELHQLVYPAPGDPVVAMKIAGCCRPQALRPRS